MTQTEFVGYTMVYGVILLVALIAIIKPIINLNTSIQKLTDAIEHIKEDMGKIETEVKDHNEAIHDHEIKISMMEKQEEKKS